MDRPKTSKEQWEELKTKSLPDAELVAAIDHIDAQTYWVESEPEWFHEMIDAQRAAFKRLTP